MYSEHKHVPAAESTALGGDFPWRSAGSSGLGACSDHVVVALLSEDAFRHG
jgi:hypothetical protein